MNDDERVLSSKQENVEIIPSNIPQNRQVAPSLPITSMKQIFEEFNPHDRRTNIVCTID